MHRRILTYEYLVVFAACAVQFIDVNIQSFRSDMCANEMVDLQYTILTVLLIIPFYRIYNKP
jgi:hypothetical protein